ncbi:SIMPL domain-containing protein [Maricaulis sp.]|uniref:SIMPL domain-containing protein n=1 Tax=Maricaulis sp. TaxID=1486257 RepID=UPI002B26AAFB|nr:SIMPL domain-containing protein [Maricaulis sp.]
MIRALITSTALVASLAAPAFAQAGESEPTLSLSESATVQIAPEFATVSSGVVTRAETARDAVRANGAAMSQVFDALRRAGVDSDDMQTAQLSVSPVYADRQAPNQIERTIIGYETRNQVSAKVRDTSRVGQVIDAMVSAGANNINGVTFGAEDTGEAMDNARRQAIAALLAKADLFADAAGFELCGIRRMGESNYRPQPVYESRMMAADSFGSTPIAAGELTLTATVSADFCINQ